MYLFFFIPIVSCSDYYLVSYISFCLKTLYYHQLVNKDSKNKKKTCLSIQFPESRGRAPEVLAYTLTHPHIHTQAA